MKSKCGIFGLLLLFSLLFAMLEPAVAANSFQAERWLQEARNWEAELQTTKSTLEQISPADWPEAVLAKYQVELACSVYYAFVSYVWRNDRMPTGLSDLVGEYLTEWPLNPQDEWNPVDLASNPGEFVPGGLVLQVCPPSEYSMVGSFTSPNFQPMSFVISAYGPILHHSQGCTGALKSTAHWAVNPQGSVAVLEQFREPAAVTMQKIQDWLDWQLEQSTNPADDQEGES